MNRSRACLLLFDLDGTLMDTGGAGQRAMRDVGRELFGNRLDFDAVQFGGLLDPLIYARAAAAGGLADPERYHTRFCEAYAARLPEELAKQRGRKMVLPGVNALLDALHQEYPDHLGLLTGNYTLTGPIKLRHGEIDPDRFVIQAWGDLAPTRADLVAWAMQQQTRRTGRPTVPQHVMIIGDTPRDIACARAHGCRVLAVATGRFTMDQLKSHQPDHLLEDLADLDRVLDLLRANPS
ncbi:MAG: HAD family hydrolase [Planctomycetota bacterium]